MTPQVAKISDREVSSDDGTPKVSSSGGTADAAVAGRRASTTMLIKGLEHHGADAWLDILHLPDSCHATHNDTPELEDPNRITCFSDMCIPLLGFL